MSLQPSNGLPVRSEDRPEGAVYLSPLLSGETWIDHGFGTRHAHPWGMLTPSVVTVKQIHSNRVLVLTDSTSTACLGEADALVSAESGSWLAVRTADCVPILFADPANRAIAAAHAGWRGTVAEIAARVLAEMKQRYGTRPQNILAAIGPAIGECCFEVGSEVACQFRPWWPQMPSGVESQQGKSHVNLAETLVRQLTHAGVPFRQIDTGAPCTMCEDRFHSFRRDREQAGRMHSAIRIKPQ